MRIRFKKTLLGDYGRAVRHEVKDVSEAVAKSLIGRDLAEAVGDREELGRPPPAGLRPAGKGKRKASSSQQ